MSNDIPKGSIIYISAPMTGVEGWNKAQFHKVAAYYRDLGMDVINPAEIDDEHPMEDATWWDYIDRDCRLILTLQPGYIVHLSGWQHSPGALIENIVASMKTGSKIIYHDWSEEL